MNRKIGNTLILLAHDGYDVPYRDANGEKDPERAAQKLAKLCPGRVFVSLGPDGMIAAERGKLLRFPVYDAEVINTNGAGDAAAAAIVWALTRCHDATVSKRKTSARPGGGFSFYVSVYALFFFAMAFWSQSLPSLKRETMKEAT